MGQADRVRRGASDRGNSAEVRRCEQTDRSQARQLTRTDGLHANLHWFHHLHLPGRGGEKIGLCDKYEPAWNADNTIYRQQSTGR
jgi:hypothetical protein